MRKSRILLIVLGLLLVFSPAAAQGGTLTYGSSVMVSITADAPFGFYTFTGNTGDRVMAYAIGTTPDTTPGLSLLDMTQAQLAANDACPFAGGNAAIACVSYRLPQSGTYSLVVSNTSGLPGDVLLRLDGSPASANPTLTRDIPTEISIPPGAEAVTYSFNGDPALPLNLSVSTASPDFAFTTRIYDPSGQLILVGAGTSFTGINMQTPPGAGTYDVTIQALTPDMQGVVTLLLSAGQPVAATGLQPTTIAATQPPPAPDTCQTTAGSLNVNVRSGPGTNYPVISALLARDSAPVTGQSPDGTWYVVTVNGRRGWVAASVTNLSGPCQNLPVIQPPPTPTPAPATAVPTAPTPQISFTVNGTNSVTINQGDCATVEWNVQNVQAVFYQGQGVTGQGSRQECPGSTTTYTLDVTLPDNSTTQRTVTINVSAAPPPTLNPAGSPDYGSLSLAPGFVPDPQTVNVTSGGPVDISYLGNCWGFAASNPDFRLQYGAGGVRLRIYFIGNNGDTVLVVQAPDGSWHCNDDGAGYPNPLIEFINPASGTYNVWVASYNSGENISGTLYMTELLLP